MAEIAYGLIETIRVREGRVPLLARHLARLERSRAALGLPRAARDVAALVQPFAGMGEAVLRVELRGADVGVTVRELPSLDPPAVVTAAQPHVPYPHKTTERDTFDEALAEAEVAEADDALLVTSGGWVAEGTTWSVFWWEGDGLRTPALALGILPGIGRARVMELAPVEEGSFPRGALAGRSAFLTNAVRGILPLASLDGAAVPGDARTAELAGRLWLQG
jgi:branched-subunit amino acid aminotransferase/4-amino-4-deoxychorismate lyase